MCDPRYEKEDPNEDLNQILDIDDLNNALIWARREIDSTPNKAEKIKQAFNLIKKTPSISDVIFVQSLMLKNRRLDQACSQKMKVLQNRRAKAFQELQCLLR